MTAADAGSRIRITGGRPDDTEVAAVTVALLATAAGGPGDAGRPGPPGRAVTWAVPGGFRSPASWAARY